MTKSKLLDQFWEETNKVLITNIYYRQSMVNPHLPEVVRNTVLKDCQKMKNF